MTDTPTRTPPEPDLPRPPHGGSFVRQPDGSLVMVDGAVATRKIAQTDTLSQKSTPDPLDLPEADKLTVDPDSPPTATAAEQHEG